VSDPTNAVKQAREAAAMMRARGAYGEQAGSEPPRREKPSHEQLFRWAVIEPDLEDVRSTRRFGAPFTAFKRLLLRLLEQYHAELLAQQTRFNVTMIGELRELERRLDELERRLAGDKRSP
jgi:hypothetical protein